MLNRKGHFFLIYKATGSLRNDQLLQRELLAATKRTKKTLSAKP